MRVRMILVAICLAFVITPWAQATDTLEEQAEALDLESLEDSARAQLEDDSLLEDIDFLSGIDLEEGLIEILDTGSQEIDGVLRKAIASGVLLLVIVLLCALVGGTVEGKTVDVVSLVGALAITAVAVSDVNLLIGLGRDAISGMETFSKVLLPTVTAAAAASGTPSSAVARQFITLLFSDILMTLINRVLIPLLYAYLAMAVAYAAMGNEGLKRIGDTIKWVVTTLLTTILIAYVTYLTVSGVITGATDSATIKATKFAVSSVIPVVGSILSDATETLLAGAGILKNTVGLFGMLVVLGICVTPFLWLAIHYLTYKVTAALTATVTTGRIGGLIDAIGGAFGLVLGMTGACAVLLLVSLISAISVVAT